MNFSTIATFGLNVDAVWRGSVFLARNILRLSLLGLELGEGSKSWLFGRLAWHLISCVLSVTFNGSRLLFPQHGQHRATSLLSPDTLQSIRRIFLPVFVAEITMLPPDKAAKIAADNALHTHH